MLLCLVLDVVANSHEGLMAGTRIGKERKRKRARRAGIPHSLRFRLELHLGLDEFHVPWLLRPLADRHDDQRLVGGSPSPVRPPLRRRGNTEPNDKDDVSVQHVLGC